METIKDFEKRRKDFIEDYGKIVEKHHCDFISSPQFIPQKKDHPSLPTYELAIITEVMDLTPKPMVSPFQK